MTKNSALPAPPGGEPALDLAAIFSRALAVALGPASVPPADPGITAETSLRDLATRAAQSGVPIDRLLSQAALVAYNTRRGVDKRATRDALDFFEADQRPTASRVFTNDPKVRWSLTTTTVLTTLRNANRTIELIDDLATGNEIPMFALLGLRNLSSFVGEIFASELCRLEKERLLPNPNQDGYPDLLALTPEGKKYVDERETKGETSEKKFWSPYPFGGVGV